MTITIRLKTDNAAFQGDRDAEIDRILRKWLEYGVGNASLWDINGNLVGVVKVTGR